MGVKGFKKICGILLSVFAMCAVAWLAGCGSKNRTPDIVVTGFAQYDWVRQIIGDNTGGLEVKYLLDNGVDLHNYLPSVQDIASISSCKLFVYTDSDAEKWISSALENPKNKDRKTVNLISLLTKEEKIVLDEESGHIHDENCDHTYDEHIWLSLKLSQKLVATIADRISQIDPDNSEMYLANAQQYINNIATLDEQYEQVINSKTQKKLLFADRYPFAYMMKDYGIEVAAAFSGCASDTEVSVQTITQLKEYLLQNSLNYVVVIENSATSIANQVISGTNAQIKTLNSMQSVTANQIDLAYLSIMQANCEVLNQVMQ